MSSNPRWLESIWPMVRSHLPAPPALVVELGCGSVGGFVPALERAGYDALGVDPDAPGGNGYRRVEFERAELPPDADAVVASLSLHHVADPDEVLDRLASSVRPGGSVVVVEWDWESFDEASARWCFERLDLAAEPKGWLHHVRERWLASGQPWDSYFPGWAAGHGLHSARALVEGLDARLERVACTRGPYFFPELADTTEADEVRAIEAERISAVRIDYVGRKP